jgi:hypothetical protein
MRFFTRREAMASGTTVALMLGAGCGEDTVATKQNEQAEQSGKARISLGRESPSVHNKRLDQAIKLNEAEPLPYVDLMGRGFDSGVQDTMGEIAKGKIITTKVSPGPSGTGNDIRYALTENQQSYYALRQFSAKAKGSYGAFSAKGRISAAHEESSNSYGLHVCVTCIRRDDQITFDKSTLAIADSARDELERRWRDHGRLVKTYGDSYVHSVSPEAHLFIDFIFQTASEAEKKSLSVSVKAKYAGIASGKASYSELVQSASSSRNIGILVTGFRGELAPSKIDVNEVDRLVKEFLAGQGKGASIGEVETRSVRELKLNGQSPGWVNSTDLAKRQRFFSAVAARLVYLDQREADALYVNNNSGEFAADVVQRAKGELPRIRDAKFQVDAVAKDAYGEFLDDGQTGTRFAVSRLEGQSKAQSTAFEPYPRTA